MSSHIVTQAVPKLAVSQVLEFSYEQSYLASVFSHIDDETAQSPSPSLADTIWSSCIGEEVEKQDLFFEYQLWMFSL